MEAARSLTVARLVALLGVAVGVTRLAGDLRHPPPTHDPARLRAPVDVGPHPLSLVERRTPDGVFVDVRYGPYTLEDTLPVTPSDARGGVYARHGSRFTLYIPRAEDDRWKLVRIDPEISPPRIRLLELPADPPVITRVEAPTLAAARVRLERLTIGAAPRRVGLLPGPSWLALGAAVWLGAGTRRRPVSAPTVALALVLVALAAVVAWPLLLPLGVGPALPAAMLGLAITLAVAAAAGPRLQSAAFGGRPAVRAAAGAGVGGLLLAVFVVASVNINGFIAPVFRPPGEGMSPAAWFVNDIAAPAAAIAGVGLLPALIGGAIYGLLGRPAKPTA